MDLKKILIVVFALALSAGTFGCSKKQQPLEEMQQPMSPEELSRLNNSPQSVPLAVNETVQAAEKVLEQLPPLERYKPSNQDIQTALKNAGFYSASIDGKIGPKTRKAIEEFQEANSLTVDGKVGPKTWAALSKYLNLNPALSQTQADQPAKKDRRR